MKISQTLFLMLLCVIFQSMVQASKAAVASAAPAQAQKPEQQLSAQTVAQVDKSRREYYVEHFTYVGQRPFYTQLIAQHAANYDKIAREIVKRHPAIGQHELRDLVEQEAQAEVVGDQARKQQLAQSGFADTSLTDHEKKVIANILHKKHADYIRAKVARYSQGFYKLTVISGCVRTSTKEILACNHCSKDEGVIGLREHRACFCKNQSEFGCDGIPYQDCWLEHIKSYIWGSPYFGQDWEQYKQDNCAVQ